MIRQFFEDDTGALSCMRLMCCVVILTILGVWTWCCLRSGQYIPFGAGEVAAVSAVMGSKALQSKFECGGSVSSTPQAVPQAMEGAPHDPDS